MTFKCCDEQHTVYMSSSGQLYAPDHVSWNRTQVHVAMTGEDMPVCFQFIERWNRYFSGNIGRFDFIPPFAEKGCILKFHKSMTDLELQLRAMRNDRLLNKDRASELFAQPSLHDRTEAYIRHIVVRYIKKIFPDDVLPFTMIDFQPDITPLVYFRKAVKLEKVHKVTAGHLRMLLDPFEWMKLHSRGLGSVDNNFILGTVPAGVLPGDKYKYIMFRLDKGADDLTLNFANIEDGKIKDQEHLDSTSMFVIPTS